MKKAMTSTINYMVFLAPSIQTAEEFVHHCGQPEVTVEAEYGERLFEGRLTTMAHHGSRAKNPAPCNWPENRIAVIAPTGDPNYDGEIYNNILISHIDLDTLGGLMAVLGVKPSDPEFWQGAEFVDVNGPHHIHELSERVQDLLNAYYAFNESKPRLDTRGWKEAEYINDNVLYEHFDVLTTLLAGPDDPDHARLIEEGKAWAQRAAQAVEDRLVYESAHVRAFITDGVFCAAGYYSPTQNKVVKATVTLNKKFNSVTVAFEDGGSEICSARKIVQKLWGSEAGGRDGIAGSPRGEEMSEEDLHKAINLVERKVQQNKEWIKFIAEQNAIWLDSHNKRAERLKEKKEALRQERKESKVLQGADSISNISPKERKLFRIGGWDPKEGGEKE